MVYSPSLVKVEHFVGQLEWGNISTDLGVLGSIRINNSPLKNKLFSKCALPHGSEICNLTNAKKYKYKNQLIRTQRTKESKTLDTELPVANGVKDVTEK